MAPKDTTSRTLLVAVVLCLACSVTVSTTAVFLRPIQARNRELERKRNILAAAGLLREGEGASRDEIESRFARIEVRVVDLESGEYAGLDPGAFDPHQAAQDPALSVEIPPEEDLAGLGRRARLGLVYLVTEEGRLELVVLPVRGRGLWSTLHGFLALESDAATIRGLTFYEHGETPGLGGEVDNPRWKAQWPGKKAFDEESRLRLHVLKGTVPRGSPEAVYQADGLSGATITTRGVGGLLRYWLGPHGYGPFLARLREEAPAVRESPP